VQFLTPTTVAELRYQGLVAADPVAHAPAMAAGFELLVKRTSRRRLVRSCVARLGECKLIRWLIPPAITAIIVVMIGGTRGRLLCGIAATWVCHDCARLCQLCRKRQVWTARRWDGPKSPAVNQVEIWALLLLCGLWCLGTL